MAGQHHRATKITWSGFTSFGKSAGLRKLFITSIIEKPAGEPCSITAENDFFINCFDGKQFKAIKPQFPREIKGLRLGFKPGHFQDHTGEWWVPTSSGLCRFPQVASFEQLAHTPPKAVYTHQRGELPTDDVFRLFEDSRGDHLDQHRGGLRTEVVRWEASLRIFPHLYRGRGTAALHFADRLPRRRRRQSVAGLLQWDWHAIAMESFNCSHILMGCRMVLSGRCIWIMPGVSGLRVFGRSCSPR